VGHAGGGDLSTSVPAVDPDATREATDEATPPASWPARGLMVAGWVVMIVGAAGALGRIDHYAGPIRWTALVRWTLGLALLHDLVVAPVACLVALAVGRLLPAPTRGPVTVGLIVSATVAAVAYPAVRGFGRLPDNPSILPGDYGRGLLIVLAVVWAAVIAVIVLRLIEARRGSVGVEPG